MSNSDTINQQQEREAKASMMCSMNKGKQTYLKLTRRQWVDRFLESDPTADVKELAEGDFHIVELAQSCEMEDNDDLVSVDSEDEETEHEYKGQSEPLRSPLLCDSVG